MSESGGEGLFGGLFGRGAVSVGDRDWLQAMLDAEAALARALERAGLAERGAGAAVTAAAQAASFDAAEIGRQATLTGNPVPALVRALSDGLPAAAREAVHRGATSQDIIDTALMLLAARAVKAIEADVVTAAEQRRRRIAAGRRLHQPRRGPLAAASGHPSPGTQMIHDVSQRARGLHDVVNGAEQGGIRSDRDPGIPGR